MSASALKSLADYSQFISQALNLASIERLTLMVWSNSLYTGTAEGEVLFKGNFKLRMREEIDFDAQLITSYGYEVYKGNEKLYWYDDFPHPQDPSLASTFPHHKHIPPEIKRNRIPAPDISFARPNLSLRVVKAQKSLQPILCLTHCRFPSLTSHPSSKAIATSKNR